MGTKLVVRRVSAYANGRFVTLVPKDERASLGCPVVGFVVPDGSKGPFADAQPGDTFLLEVAKLHG